MIKRCLQMTGMIVLVLLLFVPRSFAVENLWLWVLPFEDADAGASSAKEGIAELLTVFLSQTPGIDVVDRTTLEKFLKEQQLSLAGLTRPEERLKAGKLLGAQILITGSIHAESGQLQVNAQSYDIKTSQLIGSAEIKGSLSDLASLAKNIVNQLAKTLPRAPGIARIFSDIDHSPVANLHFMNGLSRYYSGYYNQAITEFMQSSKEKVIRDLSRFWMAKCYLAQKQYDHAYIELAGLTDPTEKAGEIANMKKECESNLSDETLKILKLIQANP